MPASEMDEGRGHKDLVQVAENVYHDRRHRLGRDAPDSLEALLESRPVNVELDELLFSLLVAVFELPQAQEVDPRRGLTPGEFETMTRGGFDTVQRKQVGLTPLARGVVEFSALIAESLTVLAAAERLGVADSRVRQRLTSRTLYGFKTGRDWKLPRFQFTRDGEVPGIAQVIRALPSELHPVEVLKWFNAPNPDLYGDKDTEQPMTPLDWLRSGYNPKDVAELAEHL